VLLRSPTGGGLQGEPENPGSAHPRLVFSLYVAGVTPTSARAVASLRALCAKHLQGRCDLKVAHLARLPALVRCDRVCALSTVIKVHPPARKPVAGELSHEGRARAGLTIFQESLE
jgi:circadian clock protein KaiB